MFKPKLRKQGKLMQGLSKGEYEVPAITLAPIGIYLLPKYYDALVLGTEDEQLYLTGLSILNHEMIHWRQQLEMGVLPFYLWYWVEWLIKWLTPPIGSYYALAFEREAYSNGANMEYLKNRKPYAWLRYLLHD